MCLNTLRRNPPIAVMKWYCGGARCRLVSYLNSPESPFRCLPQDKFVLNRLGPRQQYHQHQDDDEQGDAGDDNVQRENAEQVRLLLVARLASIYRRH